MHLGEEVVEDYVSTRLTLRAHPMELLRPALPGLTPHDQLAQGSAWSASTRSAVWSSPASGPAPPQGVIFLTLEDETGRVERGGLAQDL